MRWKSCVAVVGSSHDDCTTARVAARTWQTVTCGFFPRQPRAGRGQKQVTHRRQNQMPLQPQPETALPVRQPNLAFLVLETALDRPTQEGNLEQLLPRRPRRRVAEEVLTSPVSGFSHTTRWYRQVGGPSSSLTNNSACLALRTMGPFWPSLIRQVCHGWSRNAGCEAANSATVRAGQLPASKRGVLRPRRPRR